jgi:hypothetical protein
VDVLAGGVDSARWAVLTWSWFRPVTLELGGHGVHFGYYGPTVTTYTFAVFISRPSKDEDEWSIRVPEIAGGRAYLVWWY